MKRSAVFLVGVLLVALLATACDLIPGFGNSSEQPPASNPPSANPPAPTSAANPPAAGQATLPVPAGGCQSRLWGKVTNTANGQSPANVSIEVASSGKSYKTVTDPNGLYGFAGLCAGDYALSLTPPGGKPIANPNPVKLDGTQPVKVDLNYK